MHGNTLSADTQRIVSQLAQFHGATALNVVARCYPRLAPAQGGHGLRQFECDFPFDQVPDALPVPGDADQVTITVKGALNDAIARPELTKAVEDILAAPATGAWDARVYFDNRQQQQLGYQIKVFTAPAC